MKARQEKARVIYPSHGDIVPEEDTPVAVVLSGNKDRKPVVYRLSRLNVDELGNLFESGDPDQEGDIVAKHGKL